jgi:hypothetical protein
MNQEVNILQVNRIQIILPLVLLLLIILCLFLYLAIASIQPKSSTPRPSITSFFKVSPASESKKDISDNTFSVLNFKKHFLFFSLRFID